MKTIVVTPAASQDLNAIWEFIADDNLKAADRILAALENAFDKLAKNPGIGHMREDLTDRRHRFFLVYSYLIVFRIEAGSLRVVRVLHAARDVQSLLSLISEDL